MPAPDIPTTLGALLIGSFFASVLSGIVNLQTVLYYRSYKKDPRGIKCLVFGVWFLDNIHTGFIWGGIWQYLIRNYGEHAKIDYIPWSIALTVVLTAIVTFLVHCFFAHRIFLLSKRNWFMASPVLALALLRLAAASVSTWEMFHYHSFDLFKLHARWIFTCGLSISSAVDIIIAGCLFYLFQSSRPEAGQLNQIIDKLMLYAFETGSLTCIGTIVSMICWVVIPRNLVFLGLHFVIGKLYANSLLVTLNTRKDIRRGRMSSSGDPASPVLFLQPCPQKAFRQYLAGPSKGATNLQINVQTHTDVQFDSNSILCDSLCPRI
ncbi:hypothetical protein B0H10DRAFT_2074345 [Mycena sp. CBHHK59/15]|nr:hypothetical protein B0H10DRAFT_2074345 [Mycena sp. CBHHK59/15]